MTLPRVLLGLFFLSCLLTGWAAAQVAEEAWELIQDTLEGPR